MSQSRSSLHFSKATIARLAVPPRVASLHPIAARAIYAVRLIALHERVGRDAVPELAVRLGSMEVAASALSLSKAISECWPEYIHVSRFCCGLLSHDEATIGAMVDHAGQQERASFEAVLSGLVRPDRVERLWQASLALIAAEARAC